MLYHAGDSQHTQNIQIKHWKSFAPLGYVNRFDVWVPHKLSEKNLLERISACNSLFKRNENILFLKQIVTGDEKWIFYSNVGMEEIVGQVEWTNTSHTKGRSSSKKGDFVYMVGLEGSSLLRAPSGKPNN